MKEDVIDLDLTHERGMTVMISGDCEETTVIVKHPDYLAKLELSDTSELQKVINLLAMALKIHRGLSPGKFEPDESVDDAKCNDN